MPTPKRPRDPNQLAKLVVDMPPDRCPTTKTRSSTLRSPPAARTAPRRGPPARRRGAGATAGGGQEGRGGALGVINTVTVRRERGVAAGAEE